MEGGGRWTSEMEGGSRKLRYGYELYGGKEGNIRGGLKPWHGQQGHKLLNHKNILNKRHLVEPNLKGPVGIHPLQIRFNSICLMYLLYSLLRNNKGREWG